MLTPRVKRELFSIFLVELWNVLKSWITSSSPLDRMNFCLGMCVFQMKKLTDYLMKMNVPWMQAVISILHKELNFYLSLSETPTGMKRWNLTSIPSSQYKKLICFQESRLKMIRPRVCLGTRQHSLCQKYARCQVGSVCRRCLTFMQ